MFKVNFNNYYTPVSTGAHGFSEYIPVLVLIYRFADQRSVGKMIAGIPMDLNCTCKSIKAIPLIIEPAKVLDSDQFLRHFSVLQHFQVQIHGIIKKIHCKQPEPGILT